MKENDGNHLTKCYRYYDKENRIYYYADKLTKLNNMITAIQASRITSGINVINGSKKVEEKQAIKDIIVWKE